MSLWFVQGVRPWAEFNEYEGELDVRAGFRRLCAYVQTSCAAEWDDLSVGAIIDEDPWLERLGAIHILKQPGEAGVEQVSGPKCRVAGWVHSLQEDGFVLGSFRPGAYTLLRYRPDMDRLLLNVDLDPPVCRPAPTCPMVGDFVEVEGCLHIEIERLHPMGTARVSAEQLVPPHLVPRRAPHVVGLLRAIHMHPPRPADHRLMAMANAARCPAVRAVLLLWAQHRVRTLQIADGIVMDDALIEASLHLPDMCKQESGPYGDVRLNNDGPQQGIVVLGLDWRGCHFVVTLDYESGNLYKVDLAGGTTSLGEPIEEFLAAGNRDTFGPAPLYPFLD
jgi:hypothetical protein